jgi:hypothetical protein
VLAVIASCQRRLIFSRCRRGYVGCGQCQSHYLVEVRRGLAGRETQIGGADLGQFATAAQPTSGSGGPRGWLLPGVLDRLRGRRTTWTDRIGQFNGGVFKSDQPRNYPLSKSTALCVNTAFAYPYYILPILFPHKKSLGLSPATFGIMQSVMHG